MSKTKYAFVVDTAQYAGNFERQMGGYLVGDVDQPDSHHGQAEAKMARRELTPKQLQYFEDHLEWRDLEHDDIHYRGVVSIWENPGWWNNGMGKLTRGKPPKGKQSFPAYMSVAIFFDEDPPKEIIELLKERAQKFAAYFPKSGILGGEVTIEGYRVVSETVVRATKEESV